MAEKAGPSAWIIQGTQGAYGTLFLCPDGSIQRGGAGGVKRSEARVFTDRREAERLVDALNRPNPERKTFTLISTLPPQESLFPSVQPNGGDH